MGLAPDVFWNMTITEWQAALGGFMERHGTHAGAPLERKDFEALMRRFPDGPQGS